MSEGERCRDLKRNLIDSIKLTWFGMRMEDLIDGEGNKEEEDEDPPRLLCKVAKHALVV